MFIVYYNNDHSGLRIGLVPVKNIDNNHVANNLN